ncbi:MAG: glycosyltransferase family 4 protein [Deltaproteobacteria bacterium]|nr:glycosyltransferase family 4 protein [Deltaproteobacteria bacterium]
MKILLAHNYYGSTAPSGENQVFEIERDLLRQRGHKVLEYVRHSDEIRSKGFFGEVKGALSTPWNPWAARALQRVVYGFQPDVVHVHNTFPLLSPAIFHAIGTRVPMVLTLHNYRLFCPAAIPIRAGRVCTECLDTQSVWPAVRYGCYRNSRLSTLPLAFSVALHRNLGTWTRHVDAFIALTKFQRKTMVEAGLPAERVHVKPNFIPGNFNQTPGKDRGKYAVFVGRLSLEKGVRTLLSAWRSVHGLPLRILGDGPFRGELEAQVRAQGINAEFLGGVHRDEVLSVVSGACLQIVPSECYEGFPMVILEAYACGTPVVASRIGSLAEIVLDGETGLHFEAGDPVGLAQRVNHLVERPELARRMGMKAREIFLEKYTAEKNLEMLMGIYSRAREDFEKRKRH